MRVGEEFTNKWGSYKIVEWYSYINCTIKFNNGYVKYRVAYNSIEKSNLNTPLCKTVHNIGYIGIGRYNTKEHKKAYIKWKSMISRCYYENYLINKKTYVECTVDERWHNFQTFAEWFYSRYEDEYMYDWDLDKDLFQLENKIYSPETCCLIPKEINTALKRLRKPVKYGDKFKAICGQDYLGLFNTYEEAEKTNKCAKIKRIREITDKYKTHLDLNTLQQLEYLCNMSMLLDQEKIK